MKVSEVIAHLQTLPPDANIGVAEWHNDGWHFITPMNPSRPTFTFQRYGEQYNVLFNWDNCRAHKIAEKQLKAENANPVQA